MSDKKPLTMEIPELASIVGNKIRDTMIEIGKKYGHVCDADDNLVLPYAMTAATARLAVQAHAAMVSTYDPIAAGILHHATHSESLGDPKADGRHQLLTAGMENMSALVCMHYARVLSMDVETDICIREVEESEQASPVH